MPISLRTLAVIVLGALLQTAVPLHGQPLSVCPPPGAVPPEAQRVTIGHFGAGGAEIGEFCRYLVRSKIWPTFEDFGSLRDATAAQRVETALGEGKIDVLWLTSSALGMLASRGTQVLKVLAVTDFSVIHVISSSPNAHLVTDAAFTPTEVMVKRGISETYADVLFEAVGVAAPRCLEPPIRCSTHPGEGLMGGLIVFLGEQASRAVVLASSTFSPRLPDAIVRTLLQVQAKTQPHLVGIPSQTVVKMETIRGALAVVPIPKGHYGLPQNRNVPPADVPTAAAPLMLVSGTPPEVAGRVRDLAVRVNRALLDAEPRVSRESLVESLRMVRLLGENSSGRVKLHDEYVRQLTDRGIPTGQPLSPILIPPILIPPIPIPPPRPKPPSGTYGWDQRAPHLIAGQG